MRTDVLVDRLNDRLRVDAYAGVDPSANGLQVAGPDDVDTAAFAVDAATATIGPAVDRGADLLVVHHGVSWGGIERVTGRQYGRIEPLIRADCALYAAHLPLDGHPELGNAAGVADAIGLVEREPFGTVGDEPIGLRGRLADGASIDGLAADLATHLDTGTGTVRTIDAADRVADVAVVTGAGAEYVDEAAAAGVDVLITGEGKGRTYHDAHEAGVGVVLGGHYATETFGVRALRDLVAGWGVDPTYVAHPTGL
jgi:dinuclear metal center YbgI/SA1388 family protein